MSKKVQLIITMIPMAKSIANNIGSNTDTVILTTLMKTWDIHLEFISSPLCSEIWYLASRKGKVANEICLNKSQQTVSLLNGHSGQMETAR
jgi:hypothetical protein